MRREVHIDPADVAPEVAGILRLLGMPGAGGRNRSLIDRSIEIVRLRARPRGIFAEIDRARFAEIYRGEGRNAPETPIGAVAERAERLALFAVTLGESLAGEIAALFGANDPALACVLDAAASDATERAAAAVEEAFASTLGDRPGVAALRYSPGYCGWHVTGQRALFAELRPEQIGIRLRESCLMEPLKSISGVIIAGPAEIHEIEDSYPFCAECRTMSCRERSHQARDS